MKHRLLEFLVKEMGFTTFGIEATYAEALAINDWVHGGPGDPEVLLSNLYFWTWNTEEVLEMMRWTRRHNENPGGAPKVSFYGFDMQYSRVAMDRVEGFLRGVDPVAADSAAQLYRCFRGYQDEIRAPRPDYAAAPDTVRTRCRTGVRAAHSLMESGRASYAPRNPNAYELALRAARVVEQNEDARTPQPGGGALREQYMAENSRWLLERPGAEGRVVLWAHNSHVWNTPGWQGSHLRSWLGGDYLIVGFTFHSGTFTAVELGVGLRTFTAPTPPASSYEREFHRLERDIFAVDLRPMRQNAPPQARWLLGPLSHWAIGSVFSESNPFQFRRDVSLPQAYDVIIHIDRTTHSRLRPFRFE
jgi:erythromycin esterase